MILAKTYFIVSRQQHNLIQCENEIGENFLQFVDFLSLFWAQFIKNMMMMIKIGKLDSNGATLQEMRLMDERNGRFGYWIYNPFNFRPISNVDTFTFVFDFEQYSIWQIWQICELASSEKNCSFNSPFCNISKCSHKISPVKGGAIARNPSRPSPTISCPCILWNASKLFISSENSRFAQLIHMRTCSALQCRGSANVEDNIYDNFILTQRDVKSIERHLMF